MRSHSVAAAGGINAAINPADDWRSHAFDTVKGSDFLGDQDAIEIMCSEAPGEVMHLEHIGVTFHRNETGELDLRAFGGASMKRTAYVADITGQAMLHVLYEQIMKYSRPHRSLRGVVRHLARARRRRATCVGVVARDIRTGAMETFAAKNVILASGGAGQCYKPTTNALICTGDGIAQAYRVGAPLMDMEMIQYHPTTLAENGFLITEGARGEGAHLLNADGERFMEKYAPNKMELASRDVVSRAEQTEINEGRGVGEGGGGIYLDITVVPTQARARGAARDRQHRPGLRGHRHHARADRDPPGPALHHGRRQDRHQRRDPDPRPLRRRRGRLRLGPRRQPPGRQLAAGHADLRPALGRARRRARHGHGDAVDRRATSSAATRPRSTTIIARAAHRPARVGDQGGARRRR